MKAKRVFLIVLDSFGIGALPDAAEYGDAGANTFRTVSGSPRFSVPNLAGLGLFRIDGIRENEAATAAAAEAAKAAGNAAAAENAGAVPERFSAAVCRLAEQSKGKDTTIGHWEIAGIRSERPLPVYPNGFPAEILEPFEKACGRGVLCNRPYSGTEVIRDYGEEHLRTGSLIVYTSADSVFQIAAHEKIVPREELYEDCRKARALLTGVHGVGRVIARPFAGEYPFRRTDGRHDFSIAPPAETVLDAIRAAGMDCIAVGKIRDIFAGRGITEAVFTGGNGDGMRQTLALAQKDFTGLCFVNLVDFDMLYGHRNDIDGYAAAISAFDAWLPALLKAMRKEDVLMITADHGCDPGYPGTDHTREYVPLLLCGESLPFEKGRVVNLGTFGTFSTVAATVASALGVSYPCGGNALF